MFFNNQKKKKKRDAMQSENILYLNLYEID